MRRVASGYRSTLLCALFLLMAAGSWGIWRGAQKAGSGRVPSADSQAAPTLTDSLGAIPTPARASASDKEIERWAGQTRQRPQDAEAWVRLADAFMQKARETADLNYYGRAEAAYKQALERNPQKDEAMIGLAWVNGGRHEFEQSILWANRALALNPKSNEAYGLLGDASVEMGEYDTAFEQYQKMLDLRPDISSYSRGAHLLHLTGDIRKATWLMEKAIKAGGPYAENTAWCRAQYALIALSNGNTVAAEQMLNLALKQTPSNYHLLAALGRVKAAKKEYPAAIESYQKAIAIAPLLDSVVALGDLYTVTGNKAEAQKQYALVETIHSLYKANGVRGDLQIAQFYADHDQNLPEALRMAEAEYQTRKNVYAADILAWCYYKNGRDADAKRMIERALAHKTPEALFLFHKGMIFARLGDRSTAQLSLYQAESLNPNFHPIYARVATETLHELGSQPGTSAQVIVTH